MPGSLQPRTVLLRKVWAHLGAGLDAPDAQQMNSADRREYEMATIRHRVGIAAPQACVYEALTTTDGLSRWWTHGVDGDPHLGGTLRFFFDRPEPDGVMEISDLTPTHHVEWHCVQGADEWVGTTLTFDLTSLEDETVLLFTHAGWREPGEVMHHCSTKWASYLLGLKAWLEGGEATPYPNDRKVSGWG